MFNVLCLTPKIASFVNEVEIGKLLIMETAYAKSLASVTKCIEFG